MATKYGISNSSGGARVACALAGLAFTLALIVAAPAAAAAPKPDDRSPFLAERSDAAIIAQVAQLDSVSAPFVDSCGGSTVCLGCDTVLMFGASDHAVVENRVFRVSDPEGSPAAVRRLQFTNATKVTGASAWTLRDGVVIRHGAAGARIVVGDELTPTEVLIAVPDVRAGDVVGWSVRYRRDWRYDGGDWFLTDLVPTRRTTLLVASDGSVAYRTFGRNLRKGLWRCNVLERKGGVETKVLWMNQDTEGLLRGPLSPPAPAVLPAVQVSYSGHVDDRGYWRPISGWNDVAYGIDSWYVYALADDLEVRKVALRTAGGLTDPLEKLEALRRFVRDRIVITEPGDTREDVRTAADVLRVRTADGFMAGILLYKLAQEAGVAVRPVLARSIDAGPFDESVHGLFQYTDLLVESLDHPGTYASVRGTPGPHGELPYHLMGGRAMYIETGLEKKWKALDEQAWKDTRSISYERYLEERKVVLAAQHWCTTLTLPGNAAALQGAVAETVTWKAGSDTVGITVQLGGNLDRYDLSPRSPRRDEGLDRYCAWRFPDATLVDSTKVADSTTVTDSTVVAGTGLRRGRLLVVPPEADAAGRTWTIPASFAFGTRFIDEWEADAEAQLFCPATRQHSRTLRLQLPPGWKLEAGPQPVSLNTSRLALMTSVSVAGGELVVERQWQWRRGISLRDDIPALARAVDALRAFEQTPIVLVKE